MHFESGSIISNSALDIVNSEKIEFLLEDIKTLEQNSIKAGDIQDYESLGNRTGIINSKCQNGCECQTPLGTVNSWDSHSHYRQRIPSIDLSVYSGVVVYCNHAHLRTSTGIVRVLLLVSTVACLTCLCTSGTVKVSLFMLPSVNRIRFMMFVNLLGFFVTCLLLFLDITHIIYLFPFNWTKLNTYVCISLGILFLIASSLILHMILSFDVFYWISKWTKNQLLTTSFVGYLCSVESFAIAILQHYSQTTYYPVNENCEMNVQENIDPPVLPLNQEPHNYKLLRNCHPVTAEHTSYVDGAQLCSSRNVNLKYQLT